MRPPVLSRALVLEAPGQAADGAGGYAEAWTALGTLRADVQLRSGRDTAGAAGAQGLTSYRIVVRAAPPGAPSRPQAGQRFREGGRLFAIRAVAEAGGAGRFLVCFAEEEVSA